MGKSLIQTVNQSTQTVADNSILNLGSVQRRFGCNLRLSGNSIEVLGEGYYLIDAKIIASPTTAGDVTVAIYKNGEQITGAISSFTTSAAAQVVTLSIQSTIRLGCACSGADSLTVVLVEGAGDVTNVSVRVEKA